MKRVCILVPDGVGVKNYLYSPLFANQKATYQLYHDFGPETLALIKQHISLEQDWKLPSYSEGVWEKFLRECIHRSRLVYNAKKVNNPTILRFWKRGNRKLKNRIFYGVVVAMSRMIGSYSQILTLEKWYQKSLDNNPFYKKALAQLKKQRPDVLFCTHQRALKVPALFRAAKALGIPTVTVIYSWDNIPKARLAPKADRYFVWSQHMAKELQTFYPEIDKSKIVVTGTPQFECYKDSENIIERATFLAHYGLDPRKKIVCFSGDDVKTSPNDPQYLYDLAKALSESNMADEVQIAFRRCPVDLSGRYDKVLASFPELIRSVDPLWRTTKEGWDAVYPLLEDVQLLVSLAFYADVVINVGSTMAFDFGMFDKPAIYINYDQDLGEDWSVETIYKYQHFRSMPDATSVYWLNERTTIAEVVQSALEGGGSKIKPWFQVITAPGMASEVILENLIV